jgi:dienelactone hydrolase
MILMSNPEFIQGEDVSYQAGAVVMRGRLFTHREQGERLPGVLVFPEGFGISEHTYTEARRIAALGYVTLACDLYGDGYFHNGPSDVTRQLRDRTVAELGLQGIGGPALNYLAARSEVDARRIAACGYCLGATVAMELALLGSSVAAVAGFHPSFDHLSLDQPTRLSCPIHLFMGTLDYAGAPEKRTPFELAMKHVRQPSWRMTIYGGVRHSFTNPHIQGMGDACGYDREAHEHSFAGLTSLFSQQFAARAAAAPGERPSR